MGWIVRYIGMTCTEESTTIEVLLRCTQAVWLCPACVGHQTVAVHPSWGLNSPFEVASGLCRFRVEFSLASRCVEMLCVLHVIPL